jgi:dihydroorotate dehydrogenase electron transfer subunit
MDGLERGERVDIIGPLGNGFEIDAQQRVAYLVAGGVGHPPIMMLARELEELGIRRVAFYGARKSSLIPFTFDGAIPGPASEVGVLGSAREWEETSTPLVLATDDGSAGFGGNVVEVMEAYRSAGGANDEGVAVYACGPERMLEAVAKKAAEWGAPCQLAMETLMACGMGTCQSCVVAVQEGGEASEWRYRLCCTDGPVFRAESILWSGPG